MKGEG